MKLAAAAIVAVTVLCTGHAHAYDQHNVAVGLGAFDFGDENYREIAGRLEWRGPQFGYNISPMAGVEANTEGGLYGFGGILLDANLGANFSLVPSFAAGAYTDGGSKDLGGVIEFRSGIELNYMFPNDSRLGLALSHKSNASIYDKNPGEETLMMVYSFPIGGSGY